MKAILLCFEGVLSLKVNFFKSELIDIRIDTSQTILADILGCLPSSYLGLPLCNGSASQALWSL